MIGQTLGHYQIVREIGAGGMGVVYQAEDTTLGRQVALKILPPELAADEERRARFAREARAVAALNHPNIVTVYSVEQAAGTHFITMELVQGKTLAELLPAQGVPLGRFFEIAIPLADAVAAAHQQGITHRDLKPANVMIGGDGRVKVLDFGLAKGLPGEGHRGGGLPTRSATQAGHTVGTPAYMSPEQAQGERVDARSDIFSLGIVFYEMLTGRRPFEGSNPASVISAILRDTPRPLSELQPAVPRALARLVDRCLAKNPVDRFQSALDLRHSLEEVKQDVDSGDAFVVARRSPAGRRPAKRWAAVAGVAALVIAASTGLWLASSRDDSRALAVPQLRNPVQVTAALDIESYPTWSPDGQRVAYQGNDQAFWLLGNHDIWVKQLGSGEAINLTKDSPANDRRPSWSPNGREIAFFSNRDGEWGVWLVPALGGSPRKVLPLQDSSLGGIGNSWSAPQWARDGSTLFVLAGGGDENVIIVLALDTLETTTRVVLPQHESPRRWDLSIRPDGGRFAYLEAGGGNPELTRLWTIDASGNQPIPLTDGRTSVWSPSWSNDGRRLFYASNRGGSWDLWQQVVAQDGSPMGDPLAVTAGVGMRSAAFSPDGTKLAYSVGGRVSNVWRVPILADRPATWADARRVTSERAYIEFVDVSPDGQQLAVSSDRRGNQDLWVLPATGGEMTQVTTDPTPDWNPRWSPDGGQIAFYAYRSGNRDIWVMPARGGQARQLTFHPGFDWFPSWSPSEGGEIAFASQREGELTVWAVATEGGEPRRVAAGNTPDWSPDGQWLVVMRQGKLFRVSRDGKESVALATDHPPNTPRVSRDGRSIYYSVSTGPLEDQNIWRLSLADGAISGLTRLEGQRGLLGYYFAADENYLYLTWYEDDGDIWVMDVLTNDGT
ncbi:MAG TPA: protein kinase [Vicinamibacterales bacterium]|nr:protein kinase [Vicinamibacterales bacterium]